MLWNTVFYRSVIVWCWASSFLFPYLSVYDIDIAWFAFWLGCAHTHSQKKRKNLEPLAPCRRRQRTTMQKHSINVIQRGGKKEKATSCLNVFKMLCFSLLLFCSFSLFSCTLSLILALESGKKRVVVVVVVVGNISCEWRPSLVSPWTAV